MLLAIHQELTRWSTRAHLAICKTQNWTIQQCIAITADGSEQIEDIRKKRVDAMGFDKNTFSSLGILRKQKQKWLSNHSEWDYDAFGTPRDPNDPEGCEADILEQIRYLLNTLLNYPANKLVWDLNAYNIIDNMYEAYLSGTLTPTNSIIEYKRDLTIGFDGTPGTGTSAAEVTTITAKINGAKRGPVDSPHLLGPGYQISLGDKVSQIKTRLKRWIDNDLAIAFGPGLRTPLRYVNETEFDKIFIVSKKKKYNRKCKTQLLNRFNASSDMDQPSDNSNVNNQNDIDIAITNDNILMDSSQNDNQSDDSTDDSDHSDSSSDDGNASNNDTDSKSNTND